MKTRSLLVAASSGVLSGLIGFCASAMPTPIQVKPGAVTAPLRTNASAIGGVAADEFSLLGVDSVASVAGERLVLKYGDPLGKPLKGQPGFFQVSLDRDGRRISIDLSQITRTGVDPTQLRRVLAKSKYVSSSEMTMDPHDHSTNLTLTLKSPVQMKISTDSGAQAKVILDLEGLSL